MDQASRPAPGEIPVAPGVYRWWDKDDRVIYVGKAKNLRSRLNSYFADPKGLHPRTRRMVQSATRLDWVTVASEVEALQLEHTWINEYEPRFNVRFRDDKSYPWLVVTTGEEFPRVFVMRGNRRKGWKYFGPFVQAAALREAVDRLLKVYPMRSCNESGFRQAQSAQRPCLLAHIDKCSAPCVGRVTAEQHDAYVAGFVGVFEGKSAALIRRLQADMAAASADLNFELAARLRDEIQAVEQAAQRTRVVLEPGVDCDLVGLAADELAACVQVFHVRDGRLVGQRNFTTDRPDEAGDPALVSYALQSIYGNQTIEIPKEVLVSEPSADPGADSDWLRSLRAGVNLRVPERGDKAALMATVVDNARQALVLHRSRRGADISARGEALAELGTALGLAEAPLRVECIDVSHLDGDEVVASLVVFEDGLPAKSEYRRFVLRHGLGNNDVASIAEVVQRRFTERGGDEAKKFRYRPQLLVVDGGPPQVQAAVDVLERLGLELPVVGLAKRLEEVWLPRQPEPVIFARNSEALFLLQRLRDEAHRFAIGLQRKRQRKASLTSVLEELPGLGPVRIKALLREFGSLKRLRAATPEEIAAVPGLGPALAEAVHRALQERQPGTVLNTSTGEVVEGA